MAGEKINTYSHVPSEIRERDSKRNVGITLGVALAAGALILQEKVAPSNLDTRLTRSQFIVKILGVLAGSALMGKEVADGTTIETR
jgi:hypothetical protein